MKNLITNNESKKVSVIVPFHNIGQYLPNCLESLYQQTLRPSEFEVIFIDDNSEDNGFNLVNAYSQKRDNVIIIRNEQTLGPGPSRNKGVIEACGEYIYFLDGDDYIDPTTLEFLLMTAYDNKADLVTSNFSRVDEFGNLIYKGVEISQYRNSHYELMKSFIRFNVRAVVWNKLIKREILIKNNFHFTNTLHEDISAAFQMVYFSKNIVYYPTELSMYYWVQRNNSIVSTITKEHIHGNIVNVLTRWEFILENESDGYIKKIEETFEESFRKIINILLTRIYDFLENDPEGRLVLYQYLFDQIKGVTEYQEAIYSNQDDSNISYGFLSFFPESGILTKKAMLSFENTIMGVSENKIEDILLTPEQPQLRDRIKIKIKQVPIIYKPLKLLRDVYRYPGNIFKKFAYWINRIIEFLFAHRFDLSQKQIYPSKSCQVKSSIEYQVLFFCDVNYHIRHTVNVVRELSNKGVKAAIIDLSTYLNQGKRQIPSDEAQTYQDVPFIKFNNQTKSRINLDELEAVLFFNDTGSHNEYIRLLRSQGIATIGIDEGVNDFLKLSEGFTGKISPYRTCEYVFLPGKFETQFFSDRPGQYFITGLPMIKKFYLEPVSFPERPLAVINVNFSYGVLTYCRDEYVRTAVAGCEKAGIDYLITQHPMDKGVLTNYSVSSESVYNLIRRCSVYISRFSGTIIEALALGKPCIYHNPHHEKVIKFQDPMGAYGLSDSVESLATQIDIEIGKSHQKPVRDYADAFLVNHANIHDPVDPATRMADVITNILESREHTKRLD